MSQVIIFNTSCIVNFEVLVNFEHELMLKRRQQIQVNLLEL